MTHANSIATIMYNFTFSKVHNKLLVSFHHSRDSVCLRNAKCFTLVERTYSSHFRSAIAVTAIIVIAGKVTAKGLIFTVSKAVTYPRFCATITIARTIFNCTISASTTTITREGRPTVANCQAE